MPKAIRATHVKDVEWIISLWLAIHGGDPGPEHISEAEAAKAAAGLILAAAAHLPAAQHKAVLAAIGQ